jgi:hypothetical protein
MTRLIAVQKSDDCTKCCTKTNGHPHSSCQPSACDSSCKSKGSSGGACYGSECRCNAIPTGQGACFC